MVNNASPSVSMLLLALAMLPKASHRLCVISFKMLLIVYECSIWAKYVLSSAKSIAQFYVEHTE